jgi:surfactin synthase thioesterase subunit
MPESRAISAASPILALSVPKAASSLALYTVPELAVLRCYNGTPEEVLENSELIDVLLLAVHADFALCRSYLYAPRRGSVFPYP